MASDVHNVTFDSSDPYALATWWTEVVAGSLADDDFPGDPQATVSSDSVLLLFVEVPEGKATKNRVHLDLQPRDRTRDEEVGRLVAHGAAVADDHRRPDGSGFVVMTDPAGNEFCIVRSAAERG